MERGGRQRHRPFSCDMLNGKRMNRDMKTNKPELRGKTRVEIEALIQRAGFQGFRARQIYHWLYQKDARDFSEMKNLPKELRGYLSENFRPGGIEIREILKADDGSRKILYDLHDGLVIESVLMPQDDRWTLCLSSQVGCKLGCDFCLTARVGFRRNLTIAEIIDQVQLTRREILKQESLTNIVFMGMGEPLLNMEALLAALGLLIAPEGIGIPSRRITVSTAGVIPGIRALGESETGVNLAVSLNASTDQLRNKIMPINRKYPLSELIAACRKFPLANRRRVTFEYILLSGVNDAPEQARGLALLLHGIRCKINLIRYNEDPRLPFRASSQDRIEAFREILEKKGSLVAVRYSKGSDIKAACGQLAAGYLES